MERVTDFSLLAQLSEDKNCSQQNSRVWFPVFFSLPPCPQAMGPLKSFSLEIKQPSSADHQNPKRIFYIAPYLHWALHRPKKHSISYRKVMYRPNICTVLFFMFAPCINSIKNTLIVPTDAHYYKIIDMLKQFKIRILARHVSIHAGTIIRVQSCAQLKLRNCFSVLVGRAQKNHFVVL